MVFNFRLRQQIGIVTANDGRTPPGMIIRDFDEVKAEVVEDMRRELDALNKMSANKKSAPADYSKIAAVSRKRQLSVVTFPSAETVIFSILVCASFSLPSQSFNSAMPRS